MALNSLRISAIALGAALLASSAPLSSASAATVVHHRAYSAHRYVAHGYAHHLCASLRLPARASLAYWRGHRYGYGYGYNPGAAVAGAVIGGASAPRLIRMAATRTITGRGDTAHARPMIGVDITDPTTGALATDTARATTATIAMGSTRTTGLPLTTGLASITGLAFRAHRNRRRKLRPHGRVRRGPHGWVWRRPHGRLWRRPHRRRRPLHPLNVQTLCVTATGGSSGRPMLFNGTISRKARRIRRPPSPDAATGRRTPSRRGRGPSSRPFRRNRTAGRGGWRKGRRDAVSAWKRVSEASVIIRSARPSASRSNIVRLSG